MKRPGDRLRALAARVCHVSTMEWLIDPIIADLQCEHAEAMQHGRRWRSLWVRVAGAWAFWRVMATVAIRRSFDVPREWIAADDWGGRSNIWVHSGHPRRRWEPDRRAVNDRAALNRRANTPDSSRYVGVDQAGSLVPRCGVSH